MFFFFKNYYYTLTEKKKKKEICSWINLTALTMLMLQNKYIKQSCSKLAKCFFLSLKGIQRINEVMYRNVKLWKLM